MEITPEDVTGRGTELFFVQFVFLILAILFTLVRAYIKAVMVKQVTPDDYLIFASTVSPASVILEIV